MTLNLSMWWGNGTKEATLMHVMATLDVIMKHGHLGTRMKPRQHTRSKKKWWSWQRLVCPFLMEPAKCQENQGSPQRRPRKLRGSPRKPMIWSRYPKTLWEQLSNQPWEGQESHKGCQVCDDYCCKPDVCVLCQFAFCWSKVCVEQDCQRADGKWTIWRSSRCFSIRPKGNVLQVVQQLHVVPPSHSVSHQHGWARKVLHHKCT